MRTYGHHIDRGGAVTVLTRPLGRAGRVYPSHIATGIPAGSVWRDGGHWRRSGSGQHYASQEEAGKVAAAVAIRAARAAGS